MLRGTICPRFMRMTTCLPTGSSPGAQLFCCFPLVSGPLTSSYWGTCCEPWHKGYLEVKGRISLDYLGLVFSLALEWWEHFIRWRKRGQCPQSMSWQQHLRWKLENLREMRALRIPWWEQKWHRRAMLQGLEATSQNSLDSFLRLA